MSRSTLVLGDFIVDAINCYLSEDFFSFSLPGCAILDLIPYAIEFAPFFTNVVLCVGSKDTANYSLEECFQHMGLLLDSIRQVNPICEILILGVSPFLTTVGVPPGFSNSVVQDYYLSSLNFNSKLRKFCLFYPLVSYWDWFSSLLSIHHIQDIPLTVFCLQDKCLKFLGEGISCWREKILKDEENVLGYVIVKYAAKIENSTVSDIGVGFGNVTTEICIEEETAVLHPICSCSSNCYNVSTENRFACFCTCSTETKTYPNFDSYNKPIWKRKHSQNKVKKVKKPKVFTKYRKAKRPASETMSDTKVCREALRDIKLVQRGGGQVTGLSFQTFQSFEEYFKGWCEEGSHPMAKRQTVSNSPPTFEHPYKIVRYICKHAGKVRCRGRNIRKFQLYNSSECPVRLVVRFQKASCTYKITSVFNEHNHKTGPHLYNHYPENRLLTKDEERNLVNNFIKYKPSTQQVIKYTHDTVSKILMPQDVHNIRCRVVESDLSNRTYSQALVDELLNLYETSNSIVHLQILNNDFVFLIIQTEIMLKLRDHFHDVLLIDGTYKVNLEGLPLYCILCQSSDGRGRPIGYIYVKDETLDVLEAAFTKFFEINSVLSNCKVVVMDKDKTMIRIIKKFLPCCKIILCIWHVLMVFKKKVHELEVKSDIKKNVMKCLREMLYSYDHRSYKECLNKLETLVTEEFYKYFIENWDCCQDMWVKFYRKEVSNLGNDTNNRCESHNQKLKMYIKPGFHLVDSVKGLLSYLEMVERSISYAEFKESKICVSMAHTDDLHIQISKVCTTFALKLVYNELEKLNKNEHLLTFDCERASVRNSTCRNVYCLSPDLKECTCTFYCTYELPCHHIFFSRKLSKFILFEQEMIPKRWRKGYMSSENLPVLEENSGNVSFFSGGTPKQVLTTEQKYTEASVITKSLASILSQLGTNEFQKKLKVLKTISDAWNTGNDVEIVEVVKKCESADCSNDLENERNDNNADHMIGNKEQENLVFTDFTYNLGNKRNYDQMIGSEEQDKAESADRTNDFENKINDDNEDKIIGNKEVEQAPNLESSFSGLSSVRNTLKLTSRKHVRGRPKGSKTPFLEFQPKTVRTTLTGTRNLEVKCDISKNDWLPHLNLSVQQRGVLTSDDWLDDKLINASQAILRRDFKTFGFQDTLLGQNLSFKTTEHPMVQILHCGSVQHWLTVSTILAPRNTVYVYDSLDEDIPVDVVRQICNILQVTANRITIINKSVQKQMGSKDCGLFAIANALTIVLKGDPSKTEYSQNLMRCHLLSCLENNKLETFPLSSNQPVQVTKSRKKVLDLYCLCRQPYFEQNDSHLYSQFDKMIMCMKCCSWYHLACKSLQLDSDYENIDYNCC